MGDVIIVAAGAAGGHRQWCIDRLLVLTFVVFKLQSLVTRKFEVCCDKNQNTLQIFSSPTPPFCLSSTIIHEDKGDDADDLRRHYQVRTTTLHPLH